MVGRTAALRGRTAAAAVLAASLLVSLAATRAAAKSCWGQTAPNTYTQLNPCYPVGEVFDAEDSAASFEVAVGTSAEFGSELSIGAVTGAGKVRVFHAVAGSRPRDCRRVIDPPVRVVVVAGGRRAGTSEIG